MNARRSLALALLTTFLWTVLPAHAETVPSFLLYEGRILDSSQNPVTTAVVLRFSLWKSADWSSGDASAGAINTSATNYGGWYEVQTLTPSGNGILSAQLGSGTTLPTLDFSSHKYLQVEAKSVGQADTSYVLLDPTGDTGSDAVDRKFIGSVAYAKNAESVGNRTVGTSSGNVLILGPNGRITTAQMGSGTTVQNFTINAENTAGDAILTFGNSVLAETLKFSATNTRFEFSDDVWLQGSLTTSGSLTASGSIETRANLSLNADNGAADAILTFGNNLGQETLKFSSGNARFEFSDDVLVSGDLMVSGTINGLDLNGLNGAPLQVSAGAGLTLRVASGSYRLGSSLVNFEGSGSVSVGANATSYVFFGSGGLTVRTASFPTDESFIPLAVATTSLGAVTNIVDRRTWQSDIREHDDMTTITPEFDKATYQADATNNVGLLSLAQDNTSKRNYYIWTTEENTLQDYDIFVRVPLPLDFVRWNTDGVSPLRLYYRSTSASDSDNALEVSVFDTNGSPVTLTGTSTGLVSTAWASTDISFAGTPTWTPGTQLLLKLHVSAKSGYQMHVGALEFQFTSLTGQ